MQNLDEYIKEHLIYEISMLKFTRTALMQSVENEFLYFVLLESFVLHARNLIDFFIIENEKKHSDDVIARDFKTNSGKWLGKVENNRTFLEGIKVRANKELAHLTLKRIAGKPEEKEWPRETIYLILYDIINEFVNDLYDIELRADLNVLLKEIGFSR